MYLYYILNQDENSMLYKCFDAQLRIPMKGDWVSEISTIISSYNINLTFIQIKQMKKKVYKKYVRSKVSEGAFNKLLDIQRNTNKSKGKYIDYGSNFKLQPYLQPNNILSVNEQHEIFAYRCRMNKLKSNFPGMNLPENCICEAPLTNIHLYSCKYLRKGEITLPYEQLFNGTIYEQKIILNILQENILTYQQHTQ